MAISAPSGTLTLSFLAGVEGLDVSGVDIAGYKDISRGECRSATACDASSRLRGASPCFTQTPPLLTPAPYTTASTSQSLLAVPRPQFHLRGLRLPDPDQ